MEMRTEAERKSGVEELLRQYRTFAKAVDDELSGCKTKRRSCDKLLQ